MLLSALQSFLSTNKMAIKNTCYSEGQLYMSSSARKCCSYCALPNKVLHIGKGNSLEGCSEYKWNTALSIRTQTSPSNVQAIFLTDYPHDNKRSTGNSAATCCLTNKVLHSSLENSLQGCREFLSNEMPSWTYLLPIYEEFNSHILQRSAIRQSSNHIQLCCDMSPWVQSPLLSTAHRQEFPRGLQRI